MINQALNPDIHGYMPLGCDLVGGVGRDVYVSTIGRLFDVIEGVRDIPLREQPLLWVFVNYYFHNTELLSTMEQIQMGWGMVSSRRVASCKAAIEALDKSFADSAQQCVKTARLIPVSGLMFSSIYNSMAAAVEWRLKRYGLNPSSRDYGEVKEALWFWALGVSGFDVDFALMTWKMDIGSPIRLDGKMLSKTEAIIGKMLDTTQKLHERDKLEDDDLISSGISHNFQEIIRHIESSRSNEH